MANDNGNAQEQNAGAAVHGSIKSVSRVLDALKQTHEREREIETMIEEAQIQAWEEEERRIAQMNGISETDRYGVGNLMKDYAEENRYNEYLVHGAILTCSNATTDIFVLPDKKEIALDRSMDETARCRMALNVERNPASVNELSFATVGDTVINENIFPFNCNCMMADVSREEAEAIANDSECRRFGLCRHLIRLNEKWDNMPRQTGYMKLERQRPVSTAAGVEEILGESDSKMWVTEEEEGITMTSILFCQRGGLISPITSGQKNVIIKEDVSGVSDQLIELLKNYETGATQEGKLLPQGRPALQPYHGELDPENVLTIGWGHAMWGPEYYTYIDEDGNEITIDLYDSKTVITVEQAEAILAADIESREEELNSQIEARGIENKVNQQFYDAVFMLQYQIGDVIFVHNDFSGFLNSGHFNPNIYAEEIINNFGEYSNHGDPAAKMRRADELDIIFYNEYKRDDDFNNVNRYGENIWGILTRMKDEESD